MTAKRFNISLSIVLLAGLAGIGLWRASPQSSAQGVSPVAQFRYRVESKTANFTAATVASEYNCNVSGGGFTATLPAAAGRSGLPLTFKVTTGGTGNTLVIDGNASETIDGSTTRTIYEANDYLSIVSDGTNWKVIADGVNAREKLSANRTYYVNDTGSDTNNGLASGTPFLTINKAIDTAVANDLSIYSTTISVDAGTYTGANVLKSHNGSSITILGDETTPANVIISTTSAACFDANAVTGLWQLRGMRLKTTTSGDCIDCYNGSKIHFQTLDFNTCATYHIYCSDQAFIQATGNYSITGGAAYHWACYRFGIVFPAFRTITLTGTPAFTTFAECDQGGQIQCYSMTFTGSATGARYHAAYLGMINTEGGGTTYLPGNAAHATPGTNPGASPYGMYK